MKKEVVAKTGKLILKVLLTVGIIYFSGILALIMGMMFSADNIHIVFSSIGSLILPSLLIPLLWIPKRKKFLAWWSIFFVLFLIAFGIHYGILQYEESLTINVTPNIDVYEYLPFEDESKIIKVDSKTLKLTEDLPVIDGAAAVFPVYSAFVNAVYPNTTKLFDGVFEYNNTSTGYYKLGRKETDVFFGAYPSEEQIQDAKANGTTFRYIPVASDAFVFFVHKDNPIESLSTEEIKGIYSGRITNWKEVGGYDEEIAPFQRNERSGSHSMLKRFMGDTPTMEAPTEMVNDLMAGIIEKVADYKSKSGSIGFSFRYYVEGIIQNPDIKLIAIDGVKPTVENIKNKTYPIIAPLYAVTYDGEGNKNVQKLLDWVLSEEGQFIIEETGYVGITN